LKFLERSPMKKPSPSVDRFENFLDSGSFMVGVAGVNERESPPSD
jgi:hypothetical protein